MCYNLCDPIIWYGSWVSFLVGCGGGRFGGPLLFFDSTAILGLSLGWDARTRCSVWWLSLFRVF